MSSEDTKNRLTVSSEQTTSSKQKISENTNQLNKRKLAGLFWQIFLLSKKNLLLARRNILGSLAEILAAFLFVIVLFILRYLYDVQRYNDQANLSPNSTESNANPIVSIVSNANISTYFLPIIYFYPDNSYVQSLVRAAYAIIKSQQPKFNATCKQKGIEKKCFKYKNVFF